MDPTKKKALEAKGWTVANTNEFLKLSPVESTIIEMRLAFAQTLRERRRKSKLTQVELADLMGSSQSRVAKMEKGAPNVSIEQLIRYHLALGAYKEDVADIIVSMHTPNG